MLTIHIKIVSCRRQNPICNMCIHICMNKKNTHFRPLRSGGELVWWGNSFALCTLFHLLLFCFF